jgi:hypothetical protein
MPRNKQERKTVEIGRKRIPLRTLLHGKEIRDAAKSLEDFRKKLNEQEFLHGAKLYVDWDNYNEVDIVARRLETDKEYADRLERARIAAEQKALREQKRIAEAEKRAQRDIIRKKQEAVDLIQKLARGAGISVDILDR